MKPVKTLGKDAKKMVSEGLSSAENDKFFTLSYM